MTKEAAPAVAEATPRPWFWDSYSRIYGSPAVMVDGDPAYPQVVPLPNPTRGDVTTRQGGADARLIVAAVNDYDRLRRIEAAARLTRNVRFLGDDLPAFVGEWVAVPAEDFDRLRAARSEVSS
jgi:hypothetical protein